MNQPFRFLALACAIAGLLAACQPQAKPENPVSTASEAKTDSPTPAVATSTTQPSGLSAAAPASAAEKSAAFLTDNNLALLWQADFGHEANDGARPTILDGFYGDEHRHISVILERVQRDAAQPNVFQVQGRTRYKKNLTPFEGTITVAGLQPLKTVLDLDPAQEASARAYTATARFVLREDPTTNGAGTYQGTALMDFYRLASGELGLVQLLFDADLPTGGGGLVFRGQWTSNRTGRRQAVAFASYAEAVLPDAMQDLYIGERGGTLNPKYARLDWSEAWDNEEWWAKPTKPSLSL